MESTAVHDTRDDLAHIEGLGGVCGDHSAELQ